MSFEKERAEAIALVEEALEDFDIDATRAEINSFVDAYTADTINDLELVDIAEAYRNFTSDEWYSIGYLFLEKKLILFNLILI